MTATASDEIQRTTRSPTTPIGAGAPRSVRASTRARPCARRDDDAGPADHTRRAVGDDRDEASSVSREARPRRCAEERSPTAATGTNGPTVSRSDAAGPVGATASGTATEATTATAATTRSAVRRDARLAVPERATRRAGTRNSPEVVATATAAEPGRERDPGSGRARRAPLRERAHRERRRPRARRPPQPTGRRRRTGRRGRIRPTASATGHHRDTRRHRDRSGPRTRSPRRPSRCPAAARAAVPRRAARRRGPPATTGSSIARRRRRARRQRDRHRGRDSSGLGHRDRRTSAHRGFRRATTVAVSVPPPLPGRRAPSTGARRDRQGPASGDGGATLVQRDRRPEHHRGGPVRLPRTRGTAAARREARAVRRRRAERPGQGLGAARRSGGR